MLTVYGLKNCDTCRTARKWLDEAGTEYAFVDLRDAPPAKSDIDSWLEAVGAKALINRSSTTWRGLSDAEKAEADNDPAALLSAHPTLIKRPVFVGDTGIEVGFKPAQQDAIRALTA